MTGEATRRAAPLAGIKILEVGTWLAGPGASAILGDLGAEIVKVEPLAGDPGRTAGNFGATRVIVEGKAGWSIVSELANRNKSSIAVDLKSEQGREITRRLAREADVFITNLRTPSQADLGIDYDTLAALNPRLVYLSVSAFGPEGPRADIGGFDPMGQAISGMMFLAGRDEPTLLQSYILDNVTAIASSHAVLAALVRRGQTGTGERLDSSLYGAAVWLMAPNFLIASVFGRPVNTQWSRAKNSPLRTTIECGDGRWIVGTHHPEEKYWPLFCAAIGRPDLMTDPRFATVDSRRESNVELVAIVDEVFRAKGRDEWLAVLDEHGLFFAPVQTIDEVVTDPQALGNGYVTELDVPKVGRMKLAGYPASFDGAFAGARTASPGAGENGEEILKSLGYTADEVEALRREKVIS